MAPSESDQTPSEERTRRSRRKQGEQARMTEVAERAGVSVMSVSRTIRDPERVSRKIRERVEKAMRETGYIPNALASSLASNRTRVAAVIVPFINASFGDTIHGITDVLEEAGYELLIGQIHHAVEREERLVEAFLSRRVDCLVLTGCTHSETTIERLRNGRIPVVETWNLAEDPIDSVVGFSNYEAGRAMTRYLIGKGRKRIAYLGAPTEGNDRARDRERGYIDAMEEAGLPHDRKVRAYRPLALREGADGCQELLERAPDIDALFAASDTLAVGALFHCVKRGLSIPDDIAVAGFDDADIAAVIHPSLTTVRVPRYEIGRRAAMLLAQRLDGVDGEDDYVQRTVDVGFEIIIRDSA
ncbi:LacI family DNA-binding transcriptional regulator [Marivibrio halodurans]|uniref:LacI family DNA-binding transcriptional regulator n=1 Tax=Marivibrio halodurans TaxID=2039722 RepID=A0A8J7V293_9PROT|nr:LacI family DNA-binding transcriptional regulator [Marivibrio halodurans]MBP5857130.1 LacI family DNA-binding transcriptional regulator [Marivibrio halodurans]